MLLLRIGYLLAYGFYRLGIENVMEGRNSGYSSGCFVGATAILGGAMIWLNTFDDNLLMEVMGTVAMVPAVIKYSAIVGGHVFDYCHDVSRSLRFRGIGRNLGGKYLSGLEE